MEFPDDNDAPILTQCRHYYTQRLQSLERFKARLPPPQPSPELEPLSYPMDSTANPLQTKFEQLKREMVALMENDVTLMRQLLSLGETMEDLRCAGEEEEELSPASSLASLTDTEFPMAVNQLIVNDDSPSPTRKQYFSRQNSVLRIPIPPSHRNRLKTVASVGSYDDGDDTSSGISTNSNGSVRSSRTPTRKEAADQFPSTHQSQNSFDSGIHLTNEHKHEVFV